MLYTDADNTVAPTIIAAWPVAGSLAARKWLSSGVTTAFGGRAGPVGVRARCLVGGPPSSEISRRTAGNISDLSAESTPGEGSTFTLVLPRAAGQPARG